MAMEMHCLPSKVGQEAESKSFSTGFRGAWFRCKIKSISKQKGQLGYFLEFFDFPDEKVTWTKVYQKPPQHSKSHRANKVELMVRQSFPPFFRESERPDSYPASDVVALVEDDWKVGDLVDWWSESCFWSGRVTKLLGNDKVQAYGSYQYCVRLVQPLQDEETEEEAFGKNITEENDMQKKNCEPSDSHDGRKELSDINITRKVLSRASRYGSSNFQEKVCSRESNSITSRRHPDTVESAIMDLEEVANRIRLLKGLLRFGFHWSNAMKPSWKLLENNGPHI